MELTKRVGSVRRFFLPSVVTLQQSMRERNRIDTAAAAATTLTEVCTAVTEQLGKGEWLLGGSGPTTVDAVVFGFFASILYIEADAGVSISWNKLASVIHTFPPLIRYLEKIRMTYLEVYGLSLRRCLEPEDNEATDAGYPSSLSLCLATSTISTVYFVVVNITFVSSVLRQLTEELEE